MKKVMLSSLIAIGLLSLFLGATSASAAGFFTKTVVCPKNRLSILPVGDRFELSDIVVSSDGATVFELFLNPPELTVLTLYMDAGDTVVSNFQGQVESIESQGLKMSCTGTAALSVTITGTRTGF